MIVQGGEVAVNGETETHRGRMVQPGDVVTTGGEEYRVCSSPP